jgi:N-acyl-D-aspartate/D-glutamate deacylase
MIREGFAADLTVFDEKTVSDRATYDKPHQNPVGISYVIVNGEVVFTDDQMTAARPGVALRGSGMQSTRATTEVKGSSLIYAKAGW